MKFWKDFITLLEKLFGRLENRIADIEQNVLLISENTEISSAYEANEEPIHSVSNIPAKLLSENDERHNLVIQNIGLHPCYIHLGEGISIGNFHSVLAADTQERQGNGGSIELRNWHGSVYALCEKETKVSILEY